MTAPHAKWSWIRRLGYHGLQGRWRVYGKIANSSLMLTPLCDPAQFRN